MRIGMRYPFLNRTEVVAGDLEMHRRPSELIRSTDAIERRRRIDKDDWSDRAQSNVQLVVLPCSRKRRIESPSPLDPCATHQDRRRVEQVSKQNLIEQLTDPHVGTLELAWNCSAQSTECINLPHSFADVNAAVRHVHDAKMALVNDSS